MRGERRRLHVQEGECEGDANRRIHIRAILQESAIEHEWMAESGVLRPQEACGGDSGDAYLTAATHDICHNMANVVIVEDESNRRPAKRQKVAEASGKGRRPEARMADTDVTRLRTPQRRARSKKKANRKVVVFESSEGSVAMSERIASTTDEDTREEMNLRTERIGSSEGQNEDLMEQELEPSEERTATTSQDLPPSERKQPLEKEDVSQPKTSKKQAKKLTPSEEILDRQKSLLQAKRY
ncbi:hypothetical protein AXG93_3271s1300 [Marchantia polymorpha subsp. ruderalis]|uniref:Uncharacterized protein n=1 Tax=Marchantia polymorpha subsp. ruderalis TaxID=1480154 RepID=A0A176VNH5_MARPO|nr:hypothetical protein AXG93_3271s1300 [Marchantia polymorpha subsp. ruderalis]